MASIRNIAVVGAGTMGSGIAQVAATAGCVVRVIDLNADILAGARTQVTKYLGRAVEKGRIDGAERDAILKRLHWHNSIEDAATAASQAEGAVDLMIEAVVEKLPIKHGVFKQAEAAFGDQTILATNTSSLSITRIAKPLRNPGRVVGMHFFNPAPLLPLVEIISGQGSDAGAVDAAFDAAERWGKTPVRVKDTPGFIVNRVARGFYLEALRLLGEGVAGVDEIDVVLKQHGGFKMGPFELMDLVGLDVNLAVSTSVWEQFERATRFTPHDIQRTLVEQGHLGRKSGRGFYAYRDDAPRVPAYVVDRRSFQLTPLLSDAMLGFCQRAGAESANSTEQFILSRILGAVINEAGHAITDEIASREDIDTAMMKGTSYPKGPLTWAEEIGPRTVRGVLRSLNEIVDDARYEPAGLFAKAT